MVTPRLLLLYNFGIAILFVAIGALSMVALEPLTSRQSIVPPFDTPSRQAIEQEQEIDRLRARALYYFELGRELKQARYTDTDTLFADLRKVCFAIGIAFAIGGFLSFGALRRRPA